MIGVALHLGAVAVDEARALAAIATARAQLAAARLDRARARAALRLVAVLLVEVPRG